MKMKSLYLLGLFLALNTVSGQVCTYLRASDFTSTFDSHPSYGSSDYSRHEDRCWVVVASYGKVVELDTETFDLENYCPSQYTGDMVNIYDGDTSIGSPDLTRCGSEGVDSYKSSGQYAYVEFKTDDSIQASGFRMSYKNADKDSGLSAGAIIGIVIGSLVALALVIGGIVCCIVVIVACKQKGGKVHSTPVGGQPTSYTNQGYCATQRYPTTGYAGRATIVVTSQTTAPLQNNMLQPTEQTHPVDANGIPMPAVYKAPY